MRNETTNARLTRRTVLGLAVAVPVVFIPMDTAHAKPKPPLDDAPSVTVLPTAQQVTTSTGAPGVRLSIAFSEPDGTARFFLDEIYVGRQFITDINPSAVDVTGRETFSVVVSPLSAHGNVTVVLRYHIGADPSVLLAPVQVTVLPSVAAIPPRAHKPHKPRKPPKSGATK